MSLKINPENGTIKTEGGGGITLTPSAATTVTVNEGILLPDGTKTAPAVRFVDDNNTGIYSPINDTVAITGQGEDVAQFEGTVSAVNHTKTKAAVTGTGPIISAEGTDVNIDLNINPKGTGSVVLDGIKYPNTDGTANQVIETDGAGNLSFVDQAAGGGGATVLNDLTDVSIPAPGIEARYWRINFTENGGDANLTGFEEIEFKDIVNGVDLTGTGVAIFGTENASFPASNAFDNNTSSYLTDTASPFGYIGYDFGNPVTIVEYTIKPYPYNPRVPYAWTLEYSSDGTNWTIAKTETTQPDWSAFELRTFTGVTPSSLTIGAVLGYDGTIWNPTSVVKSLSDLTDVNLLTSPPSAGQLLQWDNTNGEWVAATIPKADGYYYSGTIVQPPTGTGEDSISIGELANTGSSNNSIAIGKSSTISTLGPHSNEIVIGFNAKSASSNSGNDVIAIGTNAGASGNTNSDGAIFIGLNADMLTNWSGVNNSIAIGAQTELSSRDSIAIGYLAHVQNIKTVAIGYSVFNNVANSTRIGEGTTCILHLKDLGRLHLEGAQAAYIAPSYATSSEPTAIAGAIIYDSTLNKLKVYNGSAWETITSV